MFIQGLNYKGTEEQKKKKKKERGALSKPSPLQNQPKC